MRGIVRALLLPAVLLVAWELSARTGVLPYTTLSRPSEIAVAGWAVLTNGSLLYATQQTFQAAFLALSLGVVAGVAIGIPLGLSKSLQRVVDPTIEMVRNIPAVSMAPLWLMIFGFGARLEAGVAVFGCTWPVLFVTVAAVRAVEPRLLEVARTLELSPWRRIVRIVIPAIVPRLWVGVRISAALALAISVTVEIMINPFGLGASMMLAGERLEVPLMWAYFLWIGIVGWAFNLVLREIERLCFSRFNLAAA